MESAIKLRSAFLCLMLCATFQCALAQHTNAKFQQLPPVSFGTTVFGVAVADFNQDGKMDVVAGLQATSQLAVFLGNGDGTFQTPILTSVTLEPFPKPIIAVDVNGDGKPDVVFPNKTIGKVEVYLGNGDGTFQAPISSSSPVQPFALASANLDTDGPIDFFVGGNGKSAVLFGSGDGTLVSRNSTTFGDGFANLSPVIADLNKDGRPDLISASFVGGSFVVALSNRDGTFQQETTYLINIQNTNHVLVGDFNGDGNQDVMAVGGSDSLAVFFTGAGDGTFSLSSAISTADSPGDSQAADIDGDQISDLVTNSLSTGVVEIDYGAPNRQFIRDQLPYTAATGSLLIADLDGDGLPDLIYTDPNTQTFAVLLQTKNPVPSFAITSSANPADPSQKITFTATATGQAGVPTGTLVFKEGTTTLGTGILDASGVATFAVSTLSPGLHHIFVAYGGDANYAGTGSDAITQTVHSTTTTDLQVSIQRQAASVLQGNSFRFDITVTNNGPAPATSLTIKNLFAGTNGPFDVLFSGMSCTPDLNMVCTLPSLGVGASTAITVSGNTTNTGTLIDSASVYALETDSNHANDSASSSIDVLLPAPQATFAGTNLAFGTKRIGIATAALTTMLTNSGTGPLHITAISAPAPFNATSDCAPTLAVQASCTVSITATPANVTQYNATLAIVSDSTAVATTVNLSVIGGAPNLVFDSALFHFPAQLVLATPMLKLIGLSNQGAFPLMIQNANATGDFEVVNNACPTLVDVSTSCGINVRPRAGRAVGPLTGSLVITSDAPGSPQTIPLSGTVIDISLSLPRISRSTRGGASAHVKTAEISVAGYSEQPVHLACGPLPAGVQCQFGEQNFLLNGAKTVNVSVVTTSRRAGRLSAAAPAMKSLRVSGQSQSDQGSSINVEVTATSEGITRSIAVPLSLP